MRICFIVGPSANWRLLKARQTKRAPGGAPPGEPRRLATALRPASTPASCPGSRPVLLEAPRFPSQDPIPLPNKLQTLSSYAKRPWLHISPEDFKMLRFGSGESGRVTRRCRGSIVGSFPARRDKGKYFNCSLPACFSFLFLSLSTFFSSSKKQIKKK